MDLISREEALGEIKARFEDAREWYRTAKDEDIKARAEATIMSFTECSLMLKRLPSAERKGHWIEHENPKGIFSIECSECGCWFLREHLVRNSFCPNCGARMVTHSPTQAELEDIFREE